MDKEQARFILRSFRPDGADADDHDFTAALALATENRELGEWLARERALDATFACALSSVKLPASLREDILGCLAGQRTDFPQVEEGADAAIAGVLASIQPPPPLRNEIIAAMGRTTAEGHVRKPFRKRLTMPLAAAAGIALAFLITRKDQPPVLTSAGPLPVDIVQTGFIHAYESPLFSLDEKREDHQALISILKSRSLPCPCHLPPGLENVKGIGCRELVIDGKRGSLICFDEREAGVVHLVIFRRQDVSGTLPSRDHPSLNQHGNWAIARWEDHANVFILVGHTDVSKLAALF